jgi:hypothetical protein
MNISRLKAANDVIVTNGAEGMRRLRDGLRQILTVHKADAAHSRPRSKSPRRKK